MAQQYSIIFNNQSRNQGNFCVFQQPENFNLPHINSLAWFAQVCNPKTSCKFTWSLDYCFCWGEPGLVQPGVAFYAYETMPADLKTTNQITLDYNGAFLFTDQGAGSPAGLLYITETNNVPFDNAWVGIGMSGKCTNIVAAQPNLSLTFRPSSSYYVLFDIIATNQVLSDQQISQGVEVVFPDGIYTMYVTINGWNVITVSQTPF